jgi:soluble lytic murein transglycosylase
VVLFADASTVVNSVTASALEHGRQGQLSACETRSHAPAKPAHKAVRSSIDDPVLHVVFMRWLLVLVVVNSLACGTQVHPPVAPIPPPPTQREAPPQRLFTDRRAAFEAAYRHVEKGEFEAARPILESISTDYPELEDYCLYYLGLSNARAGRTQRAIDLWQSVLAKHPRSVHAPAAALELGRLLFAQGNRAEAGTALMLAVDAGDKDVSRLASLQLARIDIAAGDLASANDRLMSIRRQAPGTSIGNEAKREVEALRRRDPDLMLRGSALRDELRLLVREGDHTNAILLADRLLASAPEAEHPRLLRLRADAESGAGRVDESLATLREIYQQYPDSAQAPAALFRRARLLWNRDRTLDAQEAFDYLLRRYPGDANAAEALYAMGRMDEAAGHGAQAMATYGRLVRSYPHAPVAAEAGWRIGWVLYRQQRWAEAAEAFARAVQRSPSIAVDAMYWQARSLESAARVTDARVLYRRLLDKDPTNYYAYWAERRLGQVRTVSAKALPRRSSVAIPSAPLPSVDTYHLTRARELQAMGILPLARRELRAFERGNRAAASLPSFLIDAYPAVDGYRDAIRLAHTISSSARFVFYPLAFWPQITTNTSHNGVDPFLVLSLMRQESMFDPEALSPADARGLMQLMPKTAVQIARRVGRPAPSPVDLYDADVNIMLGVAHLRYLLDLYGGNPMKALAAYNGGEDAVARWDRQSGGLDLDEWVESITYRETRSYVKKVISNQLRYENLYGASGSGS